MTEEATIVVKLDTSEAERKLRGIGREGETAAARVSDSVTEKQGGSGGIGALALGTGIGIGVMGARAVGRSAFFEGATAGLRAGLSDLVGGPEARASQRVREEAKATMGHVAHTMGPSGIQEATRGIRQIYLQEEKGKSLIDQALGGEGAKAVMTKVEESGRSAVGAIKSGFDSLIEELRRLGR